MNTIIDRLLIIGSASVHTWRFLAGIAPYTRALYFASNQPVPAAYSHISLAGFLPVDFRLTAWRTTGRLRRWFDEIQPDLLHVHQANSVAWHASRALRGKAIPQLLTAWGSDVLLLPQRNWLLKRMVIRNLTAADWISVDSLSMAARIRALAGDAVKISLLNYGIDQLPDAPVSATREKRVLSCRLHKPLYRIDAIVRAWASIEQGGEFPDWQLTIAANGSETAALQAMVAQQGLLRVEFTGFVPAPELAALYQRSRVFVSVPCSDATSISLLEAMAHGCLPVLSNLPANGEWVIDGLNGHIVEDLKQLADGLRTAMTAADDPVRLERIAGINRGLVAEKALHADNMGRFAALYQQLLACPARERCQS